MPANITIKDSQRPENIELTAQISRVEMPPGRESSNGTDGEKRKVLRPTYKFGCFRKIEGGGAPVDGINMGRARGEEQKRKPRATARTKDRCANTARCRSQVPQQDIPQKACARKNRDEAGPVATRPYHPTTTLCAMAFSEREAQHMFAETPVKTKAMQRMQ